VIEQGRWSERMTVAVAAGSLPLAADAAFVRLLCTAAAGEAAVEEARRRLCALAEFGLWEAWAVIQGCSSLDGSGQGARLTLAAAFGAWLGAQPHSVSAIAGGEQAALLAMSGPVGVDDAEASYQAFVRLVLPRGARMLRKEVLGRAPPPWRYDVPTGRMPPEVALRLCELVERELDFHRQLRPHREAVKAWGVGPQAALKALPTGGGPEGVRRHLVEERRCLSAEECAALLQRLTAGAEDEAGCALGAEALMQLLFEVSAMTANLPSPPSRSPSAPATAPALAAVAEVSLHAPHRAGAMGVGISSDVLTAIYSCILRQGELDMAMATGRTELPLGVLAEFFGAIDTGGHGYISALDLLQFARGDGEPVHYASICALLKDLQLQGHGEGRTGHARGLSISLDLDSATGLPHSQSIVHLSFRDFAALVLEPDSLERRVVERAASDEEARSAAFVLRHSTPCVGCGADVQRDSHSTDCPLVECPCCGAVFECLVTESSDAAAVPPVVLQRLRSLVRTLAEAELRSEMAREHLAELCESDQVPGGVDGAVSAAFRLLSGGRPSMVLGDVRRGLLAQGFDVSQEEKALAWAWRHYGPKGTSVIAPELQRHLRSRTSKN